MSNVVERNFIKSFPERHFKMSSDRILYKSPKGLGTASRKSAEFTLSLATFFKFFKFVTKRLGLLVTVDHFISTNMVN